MNKIKDKDIKFIINFFLILVFVYFLYTNITQKVPKDIKEGFSANDLSKITSTVDNIASTARALPGEISGIATKIDGITSGIPGQIQGIVNQSISPIQNTLNGIPSEINNAVNQATSPIQNTLNGIPGEINNAVNQATGPIKNTLNSIPSEIETAIHVVTDPIKKTLDAIPGEIAGLKTEILNVIKNEISTVTNFVNSQIKSVIQIIEDKIQYVLKIIEDKIQYVIQVIEDKIQYVIGVIKKFGNGMASIINVSIIDPFLTLFSAIGNIFVQLFNILMMIVDKIILLPSCIFIYQFGIIGSIISDIYDWLIPNFIANAINTIYAYTLKIPINFIFNFISKISGYESFHNKCYNFNIKPQINSIKDGFNKVGQAFIKDFGHIDFSKLI